MNWCDELDDVKKSLHFFYRN